MLNVNTWIWKSKILGKSSKIVKNFKTFRMYGGKSGPVTIFFFSLEEYWVQWPFNVGSRWWERGFKGAQAWPASAQSQKRRPRLLLLASQQILGKCSYYHLTIKSDERDKRLAKAGQPCLSDQNLWQVAVDVYKILIFNLKVYKI